MSGCAFPVGLCTLLVNHHGISQPSTTSWELASPSWRLLGHVSHAMRWPIALMSKGSDGACTPSGIPTFLLAAFTAQRALAPALSGLVRPPEAAVLAMLELEGDAVAEDIARVWSAGQAGEGRWCNSQPLRRRQVP